MTKQEKNQVAEEDSPNWAKRWPKEVVQKHLQRQEALKKERELRIEHKKQRMINRGVPAEKRSI